MKFKILFLFIAFIPGLANATIEACNSWKKCLKVKLEIDRKIASLPRFDKIARTKTGEIDFMVQSSELMKRNGHPVRDGKLGAVEYCASQGMRLPIARELAQLYAYEVSDNQESPLVRAKNPDGSANAFSVSGWTNSGPEGELNNWFWTSSTDLTNSQRFYTFNGEGNVDSDTGEGELAVRCVLKK